MKKILTILLCCVSFAASAQVRSISGTVTSDGDGGPIGGVMVLVQGTNTYAVTGADGRYTINASQGDVLVFDLLGFIQRTVDVGTATTIDVGMSPDATTIEELVVVGYGVQKKSVVTAAIGSVKAADLETQTPTRIESMLQGKVAGVNIVRDSGQPGSGTMVRIRGIGTYNDSNPLYVVDGMQMGSGDGIHQINPTDIASIEVLKDAASAAVYGTRGANGVILITTKRGAQGDAKVTYDMQYGWQNPWKLRPMLNSFEYQTMMNEMSLNAGRPIMYTDPSVYKYDTNWQKELFYFDAPVQNHQASISGANDRVNYYLSFGYFDQAGIVGGNYGKSNYDRMSIRSNTSYKLMDKSASRDFLAKANLGVNATYAHTNDTGIGTRGLSGSELASALMLPPNQPVYVEDPAAFLADVARTHPGMPPLADDQGRVFNPLDTNVSLVNANGDPMPLNLGEIRNPLSGMYTPTTKNWADKFVASFWADLELYKGLTFRSSYGVDMAFWGNNGWSRPFYRSATNNSIDSGASAAFNRGFTWQLENTLNYNNTFGKHSIAVLLGQSARANKNSSNLSGSKKNLVAIMEDKAYINFTTDAQGNVSGGAVQPYRLASYFGRISYNFDERYMLEVTLRRDGSSRFGTNYKWAMFPSASVGWNITNEPFADGLPRWISNLKLRASWGQNGNDNIGNFLYTSNMGFGNTNKYIWGGGRDLGVYQIGAQPNRIANPDLKWETSEQIDIGLEAGFFNSQLNFSFDWYQKNTRGMLLEMMLPQYVGNSLPMGNMGDMFNTGVEFEIDYNLVRGDWSFGAAFNATYLKNRLENLGNASGFRNVGIDNDNWGPGNPRRDENGMPYHYFWGKKTAGIFQTLAEVDGHTWTGLSDPGDPGSAIVTRKLQPNAVPGDVIFVDVNNDGYITDDDKTMIGNWFPAWTYNVSLDAAWKGIDVSMFWQGVANVDIFDYTLRTDREGFNLGAHWLDRWTGPGTSNRQPRITGMVDPNGNASSSDLYIQNGAYLRLKSLQVGYTLPAWITKKALISKLRVYFMAENLLTFTSYRGFDPELQDGVDLGTYPQPRTLSVGINLAF